MEKRRTVRTGDGTTVTADPECSYNRFLRVETDSGHRVVFSLTAAHAIHEVLTDYFNEARVDD